MPDFLPTLTALATLTLGGSAAILVLSLVSHSTRSRYGARWRCLAWLLLGLRMAIPFPLLPQGQSSPHTPIQLPAPSDTLIFTQQPPQLPTSPPQNHTNTPLPTLPQESNGSHSSAPAPETPAAQHFTLSLAQILLLVWLAGVAVMLLRTLWLHLRFLRYLRRWVYPVQDDCAVPIFNELGDQLHLDRRPRLMYCTGLKTPMLAGLFRPALLLPDSLSDDALRYSLLHELTHFRRKDIWLKSLALWVNILHWFNPFAWLMVRLVERDTELACDEDALRQLPRAEHAAYGQTILSVAARLQQKETP